MKQQTLILDLDIFKKAEWHFPQMYEVLLKLQEDGHLLYLFAGGNLTNQSRKITQLGLEPYFSNGIFIYEHKNIQVIQKLLNQIKANKNSTWMVGNSLKTAVLPAIELGINAVHIPAEFEWSYQVVDKEVLPNGIFAELTSFLHLPRFISEYSCCLRAI